MTYHISSVSWSRIFFIAIVRHPQLWESMDVHVQKEAILEWRQKFGHGGSFRFRKRVGAMVCVITRVIACARSYEQSRQCWTFHYGDVIMGSIASQITSLTIVYSTVYSGADQRKHQSSASLAFVWGIHRGPVSSPHKWPVTPKMFPFDDVIMYIDGLIQKRYNPSPLPTELHLFCVKLSISLFSNFHRKLFFAVGHLGLL